MYVPYPSHIPEHHYHIRAECIRYRVWTVYLARGADVARAGGLRAFRRCLTAFISLRFVARVNVMFKVIFTVEWFSV